MPASTPKPAGAAISRDSSSSGEVAISPAARRRPLSPIVLAAMRIVASGCADPEFRAMGGGQRPKPDTAVRLRIPVWDGRRGSHAVLLLDALSGSVAAAAA